MIYTTIKVSAAAFDELANAIFSSDDPLMMNDRFENPMLIRGPILLDRLRLVSEEWQPSRLMGGDDWKGKLEREVDAQNPTHVGMRALMEAFPDQTVRKIGDRTVVSPSYVSLPGDRDFIAQRDFMARQGYAVNDPDIAPAAVVTLPQQFSRGASIGAWICLFVVAIVSAIAFGWASGDVARKVIALWP